MVAFNPFPSSWPCSTNVDASLTRGCEDNSDTDRADDSLGDDRRGTKENDRCGLISSAACSPEVLGAVRPPVSIPRLSPNPRSREFVMGVGVVVLDREEIDADNRFSMKDLGLLLLLLPAADAMAAAAVVLRYSIDRTDSVDSGDWKNTHWARGRVDGLSDCADDKVCCCCGCCGSCCRTRGAGCLATSGADWT